jgi:hypothetical protein
MSHREIYTYLYVFLRGLQWCSASQCLKEFLQLRREMIRHDWCNVDIIMFCLLLVGGICISIEKNAVKYCDEYCMHVPDNNILPLTDL